jgi:hypothetical protein
MGISDLLLLVIVSSELDTFSGGGQEKGFCPSDALRGPEVAIPAAAHGYKVRSNVLCCLSVSHLVKF